MTTTTTTTTLTTTLARVALVLALAVTLAAAQSQVLLGEPAGTGSPAFANACARISAPFDYAGFSATDRDGYFALYDFLLNVDDTLPPSTLGQNFLEIVYLHDPTTLKSDASTVLGCPAGTPPFAAGTGTECTATFTDRSRVGGTYSVCYFTSLDAAQAQECEQFVCAATPSVRYVSTVRIELVNTTSADIVLQQIEFFSVTGSEIVNTAPLLSSGRRSNAIETARRRDGGVDGTGADLFDFSLGSGVGSASFTTSDPRLIVDYNFFPYAALASVSVTATGVSATNIQFKYADGCFVTQP